MSGFFTVVSHWLDNDILLKHYLFAIQGHCEPQNLCRFALHPKGIFPLQRANFSEKYLKFKVLRIDGTDFARVRMTHLRRQRNRTDCVVDAAATASVEGRNLAMKHRIKTFLLSFALPPHLPRRHWRQATPMPYTIVYTATSAPVTTCSRRNPEPISTPLSGASTLRGCR